MGQTTFNFDERTEGMIADLRQHFGVKTKAEVFRKALALLDLAREVREKGGEMAIVDSGGQTSKILMP